MKLIKRFFFNLMENDESAIKRWVDIALIILILISTISFLIELSSPAWGKELEFFDTIVLYIFIVEYLLRFWLSSDVGEDFSKGYRRYRHRGILQAFAYGIGRVFKNKLIFATRPMSMIDLLALLPFFRIFRMFRLLRLLRLLKIVRYSRSMENLLMVFHDCAFEFTMVLSILLFVVIFAASTFYLAEADASGQTSNRISSLGDAFWWSIVTLATVGYGDYYPHTALGKIIGSVVMIIGIGICSLPAGIIAAGLTERIRKVKEGRMSMKNLKDHVLICGWNSKTRHMIEEFKKTPLYREHEVVVVTEQKGLEHPGAHFFSGDYTKESVLKDVGVEGAYCAMVVAERSEGLRSDGVDARTILASFLLHKNLPQNAHLMVEILNKENAFVLQSHLPQAHIIISDEVTGSLFQSYLLSPSMTDFVLDVISQHKFRQIAFLEISNLYPQISTFGALIAQMRKGLTVSAVSAIPIAVQRGKETITNPPDDFVLAGEDKIFYIAQEDVLA